MPLRRTYWTLSAWTDKAALYAFAGAEPHRTIMKRVRPWAKTATFRFWTADAAQPTRTGSGPRRSAGSALRRTDQPRRHLIAQHLIA